MNYKSLVERYELARRTWELLLPNTEQPPQGTLVLWLSTYQDHLIERAMVNAGRKFKDKVVEPDRVYRCVSAELSTLQRYWRPTLGGQGKSVARIDESSLSKVMGSVDQGRNYEH